MHAKIVGLCLPWPVCPHDELRIEPEPDNVYDPNALKVLLNLNGEWRMAGYVNRDAATALRGKPLSSVRAITAGDGWSVPIEFG